MDTYKIITTFLLRAGQSLLIWLTANILGVIFFSLFLGSGTGEDDGTLSLLSLFLTVLIGISGLGSSFFIVLLYIPALYAVERIPAMVYRFLFMIFFSLLASALVFFYFLESTGIPNFHEFPVVVPYTLGAVISSLLIPIKLLMSGNKRKAAVQDNRGLGRITEE